MSEQKRIGRPPLSEAEKRKCVNIRVAPDVYKLIEQIAVVEGLSVGGAAVKLLEQRANTYKFGISSLK